ncbi:hypothetical protein D3C87_175180 [compost metagenome]
MLKRGTLLLSGLVLSLFVEQANANEGLSTTIHHMYQSSRALGMGDAFVAVANDYNAIFYNPAGLARRDDGQVNLGLELGGSISSYDFYKDIDKIQSSTDSDQDKQADLLELIEDNYGKSYSIRLTPLQGVWVRPKWGLAFVPADVSLEMTMHQQVGPAVNTTVYADSYLALGYGDDIHSVSHGRLSWGVTGKFVNRAWASKALSAIELAADSELIKKEDLREGYTIDADVGFLWTPEIPSSGWMSWLSATRPTLGLVVRNIAETGFGQSMKLINKEETAPPEPLYRVVDVGTRWEYPSVWIFKGRGVLDVRDIGHPNWNWRKGTHLGFEFDWTVSTWWRGHYRLGLNQGFWTAGLSAELGVFNLDLVSYANDVGSFNTPRESRVYALKMNLDF